MTTKRTYGLLAAGFVVVAGVAFLVDAESSDTSASTPGVPGLTEAWTVEGVGLGVAATRGSTLVGGPGVVVASGGPVGLVVLRTSDGTELWRASDTTKELIGPNPWILYVDGEYVVVGEHGLIAVFDIGSGDLVSHLEMNAADWPADQMPDCRPGDACRASWIAPGHAYRYGSELIVTIDRPSEVIDSNPSSVGAYNISTGDLRWTIPLGPANEEARLQPGRQSHRQVEGFFLAKTLSALYLIDIEAGTVKWVAELPSAVHPATVEIAGSTILIADPRGKLAALSLDSGEELWSMSYQGGPVETVKLDSDLWVIPNGESVLALQPQSGNQVWSYLATNAAGTSVGTTLLTVSEDGLAELDATTGEVLWDNPDQSFRPWQGFNDLITAFDDTAVLRVGLPTGHWIVGVDRDDGELLWRMDTGEGDYIVHEQQLIVIRESPNPAIESYTVSDRNP